MSELRPTKKNRLPLFKSEMEKVGYLYFVRDGDMFKIGITGDIKKRMSQINNANPFASLSALLNINGVSLAERALHTLFESKNVGREWFRIDKNDISEAVSTLKERGYTVYSFDFFEDNENYNKSIYKDFYIVRKENESLKNENRLLREIITEYDKAFKFQR